MNAGNLIARYPVLWHMADPRNIAGIVKRGLLSTAALLDLFEIAGNERVAIEEQRRAECVLIEHALFGTAVIRDQKPLSMSRIEASLQDATPQAFLRFINARVFFWPTEKRLSTMNDADAYRNDEQLVLVVDTASLVRAHAARVRLSPMNSGATKPMAHPRSIAMFKAIEEFDYEARRRAAEPIAEVTIERSVPDILDHVIRIEGWRGGAKVRGLRRPYGASLVARVRALRGGRS